MGKGISAEYIAVEHCGCANMPDACFAADFRVIPSGQVNDDSRTDQEAARFKALAGIKPLPACGSVALRYLIDSNGACFNSEIFESAPAGVNDRATIAALASPGRMLLKINQTTTFSSRELTCDPSVSQ